MELNTVGIVGTAAAAPEPYRNIYGQGNVYALYVNVARDSGKVDSVLVLFQENKINCDSFDVLPWNEPGYMAALIKEGSRIEVTGAIQTYKDTETGHIQVFVWARYLAAVPADSPGINVVYAKCTIAKTPIYRETPKGRLITEISAAIPSIFAPGFNSYIPCIVWGRMAVQAANLEEGTVVYLEGRLQSRDYIKRAPEDIKIMTTWEVSVNKLEVVQEGE